MKSPTRRRRPSARCCPGRDVVVHAEPVASPEEDLTTTVRVLAARHGLGAHGIRIFDDGGRRADRTPPRSQRTGSASRKPTRQATEFEQDLRAAVSGLSRIVSHLEPVGDATATVRAEPAAQTQIRAALSDFYRKHGFPLDPHNIVAQWAGGELQVSFHCRLGAATALTEAHDLTVRLEEFLRGRIRNLGRVVIHVEPVKTAAGDSKRQVRPAARPLSLRERVRVRGQFRKRPSPESRISPTRDLAFRDHRRTAACPAFPPLIPSPLIPSIPGP